MARASSYGALGTFLRAVPAEVVHLTLTFGEIVRLIGRPLPVSAHDVGFWTARTGTGIGRALRGAGFRAELIVTEESLAVRFVRVAVGERTWVNGGKAATSAALRPLRTPDLPRRAGD